MAGTDNVLTLSVSRATQHVSALSSLLRTLQAAVRDSAQGTAAGQRLLSGQPAPVLEVAVSSGAGSPLTLSFEFNGPGHEPIEELNDAAFGAFMTELATALNVSSQRMLWGTPVRPLARSPVENERMRLFLEDLARIGDVVVSAGGRKITIKDGKVEATGP